MYQPSKYSELYVEAINDAYSKLSIEEQNTIDKITAKLKQHIDDCGGEGRRLASQESLLELVGKVGMWLVLKEKGKP